MNKTQFNIGDRFRYKVDIGDFHAGDVITLKQNHPRIRDLFRTDKGSNISEAALLDSSVLERITVGAGNEQGSTESDAQRANRLETEVAKLKGLLDLARTTLQISSVAMGAHAEAITKGHIIQLSDPEIQSGHTRVSWAADLISQLPAGHDGRNSWLALYGPRKVEKAEPKLHQKDVSATIDEAPEGERCPDCGEIHPLPADGMDQIIEAIMGQSLPDIMKSMEETGHNMANGEVPMQGGKLRFTVLKVPRRDEDAPDGVTKH